MRFSAGLIGVLLLVAVSHASVVQRRAYRNTEEILVPVTIIQDGEEIKEPAISKDIEKVAELKNLQPEVIVENIVAAAAEAEQKLEAVEAVVQAQRRIDEAIVEEEIKEAIEDEEDKEVAQQDSKLKTILAEVPQIIAVQPEKSAQRIEEAAAGLKSAVISAQIPEQIVAIVEESEKAYNDNEVVQPTDGLERQATPAAPTQTTTQQNFVQQLIQNSPLGQFFSQITGQPAQTQTGSDDPTATPVPALPGIFNPVTAVQNAAQSVVNTTTQAFQGLQQFASNLGTQFQSTLSGLGGQPPAGAASDATTARPPGPIQQLVNTFIPQPAQPAQPGPLQGLLNIFQGRPQQPAATVATAAPAAATNITAADSPLPEAQPDIREPDIREPDIGEADIREPNIREPAEAAASAEAVDETNNEVRDSGEANDSFEDSVNPDELIVVNDDGRQAGTNTKAATANN